tara:strand:- start:150 stop:452 length:303 start_codon:yes stop_codon:yes gene_type:complete
MNQEVSKLDLAIYGTKLANQRTYLAYVRTGFVIAGVAGIFKKKWITVFGIIMILGSTFQYYELNKDLNDKKSLRHDLFDMMPILYVFLSLGALFLQIRKK